MVDHARPHQPSALDAGCVPPDALRPLLQKTPFSFDVSVWEFFWPLMVGATMVLAEPGGHNDPAYLAGLVGAGVDHDHPLRPLDARGLPRGAGPGAPLRQPAPGLLQRRGAPPAARERFLRPHPRPSCTTCTARPRRGRRHRLSAAEAAAAARCRSAARSPTPGSTSLDRRLQPVPVGVPGELLHRRRRPGPRLPRRPELTAERFIPDPFGTAPGARLYRTGDLGRWLPDGDTRVPRPGRPPGQDPRLPHRAGRDRGGARAAPGRPRRPSCVVREDVPGDQRLVAYVVPRDGAARPPPPTLRALPQADAARVHGARGLRPARGAAADAERQGGPPGAARSRARPRRPRRAFVAPRTRCRGALAAHLGRGAGPGAGRHPRQLLRARRPLAAGDPRGGRGRARR